MDSVPAAQGLGGVSTSEGLSWRHQDRERPSHRMGLDIAH